MKKLIVLLVPVALLAIAPVVASAKLKQCNICTITIDDAHNVHFKYVHEKDGRVVHVGSLTCAKKHWKANKSENMDFAAKDFVTGKFHDAAAGWFLVGSKLRVGTGMDKGGAIFFADRAKADKALRANGGKVVKLSDALAIVAP